MKKIMKTMLSFAALMLCGGAWAAAIYKPIAVWDGNFADLTKGGVTLANVGESANPIVTSNGESYIKIADDATKGVFLNWDDLYNVTLANGGFSGREVTVIVAYSDMPTPGTNAKDAIFTLTSQATTTSNASSDWLGVMANTSGQTSAMVGSNSTWTHTSENPKGVFDFANNEQGIRYLAFSYKSSSTEVLPTGCQLFQRADDGTWTKVYGSWGLKTSTADIRGCSIGGPRNVTYAGALQGLKIHKIAVFNEILTDANLAGYRFPSDVNVLTHNKALTSDYVATGWYVSSVDELTAYNYTGVMAGGYVTDGTPAYGYFPTKHSDGTVTVEMHGVDNEAKGVLVEMKVEDGEVKIKGIKAAYWSAKNQIGNRLWQAANNSQITTGNGTFASGATGNGYGILSLTATPSYHVLNASYKNFNQAGYGSTYTYKFNLRATPSYADGTKVLVKRVGIACEGANDDLPAKVRINGIASTSRIGPEYESTFGSASSTIVYYNFDNGVELTVGTDADEFVYLNADDTVSTSIRHRLVEKIARSYSNLSVITIYNNGTEVTNYSPICDVVAERIAINPDNDATFTGTLSHSTWSVIGKVAEGDTINDVALKYGITAQLGGSSINRGTPLDAVDCYSQVHTDGVLTVEMHVQDGDNKKNVLVGFKVEGGLLMAKWLKGSYKGTTVNDRQTTYAEGGTISVISGFTSYDNYEVTKLVVTKADLLNTSATKPSVIATSNNALRLHLDASSLANFTLSNGEVTQWNDLSGKNYNATPASAKVGNADVTRNGYIEVVNGVPAFQMGPTGSGVDLAFNRFTGIKTVFWVMDIKQEQAAFFLGDVGYQQYDFHRGANGVYASQNKPFKNATCVRCDGVQVNPASDVAPTGLHVYSAQLATAANANRLSQDRSENGCNGGRAISELLIFNTELTNDQVAEVNKYLMKKWTGYKERTATISADTNWSEIEWSGDEDTDNIVIAFEDNAKLTFDSSVQCNSMTISGNGQIAADESLFTDGCYIKALVEAQSALTIADTITFDQTMKSGFVGALYKTATTIELRAQNKEVISINLAGGKNTAETSEAANLVTDANTYYGLAPVPGDKWNNISGRWQTGNKTVTLNSATAYDGMTTAQRDTMSLSATAQNTWNADSIANPFLRGYLDDSGGVEVSVTGIPYSKYDVIVYVTSDDARYRLAPITVNKVKYTYMNGEAVVDTGTTDWGVGLQATPAFGKNAMIIRNQSLQTLSIKAERHTNAGRGTLCAIQVINMGGEVLTQRTYASTITTEMTAANLSELQCTGSGSTIVGGELTQVTLTLEGEATDPEFVLTMDDPTIKTEFIKIIGSRPIKIASSAAMEGVVLDLSETSGNVTLAQSAKKVTVGEHARLVLADGVSVEALTNNGGTIRFESDLSSGTTPNNGAGTYEYKNAKITGFVNGSAKIHVLDGDTLNVTARTAPSLEIENGATVTIGEAVGSLWYGDGTTFVQKGGTVSLPINGTGTSGTGNGLLLGYQNGGITQMSVSGGSFTIANSSLNFYLCSSMTVSGTGHVKAKGVYKSGNAATVTVSDNGIFEIGSLGWSDISLNMNGGTFKAFETATMSAAMTIRDATTIDVPDGVTLTITGAISGSSNITKTGAGTLIITDSLEGYTGTITATAGRISACDYSKVATSDVGKILVVESIPEYASGHFTVPTELATVDFDVLRPTGTIVTKAEVLADKTAKISGVATSFDVTYTNTINFAYKANSSWSSATDANAKSYNNTLNDKSTGLEIHNQPHIENIASTFYDATDQLSFAIVGTMPAGQDTIFAHFGHSQSGKSGLMIITGSKEDEVVVAFNHGNQVTPIAKMVVPNSATKRHAYVITKDDNRDADTTTFTIYLDGIKWKTHVETPRFMISGNIQIGGDVWGLIRNTPSITNPANNYTIATSQNDGIVNCVRGYNRIISAAEIAQYSDESEFPYVSPNGTYTRNPTENGSWVSEGAWTSGDETVEKPSVKGNVVVTGTHAENAEATEKTITVNLTDEVQYEKLTLSGDPMRFVNGGNDAKPVKSVCTVVGTTVTLSQNAIDLKAGPTIILDTGKLVFDFSSLTEQIVAANPIDQQVTGDIEEDENIGTESAKIVVVGPENPGRLDIRLSYVNNCYHVVAALKPVYLNSDNTLQLADGTTVSSLYENEKVYVSSVGFDQTTRWRVNLNNNTLSGHTVVIDYPNGGSNPGISVQSDILDNLNIEIADGSIMYMQSGYKATNATITGKGTFKLTQPLTVDGALMISAATVTVEESGKFKLNTNGSVTVPSELGEGLIESNVSGMQVKKVTNEGETTTYTYSLFTPAASITIDGETTYYYPTLADAISDASADGLTVTLEGDVTLDAAVTVPVGVTLDIGSHTISGSQVNVYGAIAGNGTIGTLVMVRNSTIIMPEEGVLKVSYIGKFDIKLNIANAATSPLTYLEVANIYVDGTKAYAPSFISFVDDGVESVGVVGLDQRESDEVYLLQAAIAVAGVSVSVGGVDYTYGYMTVNEAVEAAVEQGGSYANVEVYDEDAELPEGFMVVSGHLAPIVAKIGTTPYPTLPGAIAAAEETASAQTPVTVTLARNVTLQDALNIPANVTVDVNGFTFTGSVQGAGKIKFAGFAPIKDATTLKTSLQDSEHWTGTLLITQPTSGQIGASDNTVDTAANGYRTLLNNYGNINSKIEFVDCTGDGDINYIGLSHNGDSDPVVIKPEIVITGNVKLNNGYSHSNSYPNYYTVIRKLSGTGAISATHSSQLYYIVDGSEFAGSISTTTKKFIFGERESTDGVPADGIIAVKIGKSVTIASDKTWSATSIVVNGTLTKSNGATLTGSNNNNGKVAGSGEIIVVGSTTAAGISGHGIRGLTETNWTGTLTIKDWNGAANAGSADFGNLGNANSTVRFDGYNGYLYTGTYNQIKAYDIAAGGLTLIGQYSNGNPIFQGNLTGSGPITVNMTGGRLIKFVGDHSAYTGTITVANTACVALVDSADAPVQYEAGKVIYGSGSSQKIPEIPEDATVTIAPGSNATVTFPEEATAEEKAAIADQIVVKYGETVLNPAECTKYVEVTINQESGKVELTTTEAAKPAATEIAMSTPTEGEGEEATDKVQFTITNPIPGLFYEIVSGDSFDEHGALVVDEDAEKGTSQATTSAEAKTVSIPMTFTGDKKVKYYKVSVKATK